VKSILGIVQKYYPEVTSVKDAKKGVTIEVTKGDSKNSKSNAPRECALARACSRRFGGAIVSISRAYIIHGRKALRYTVGQAISREVVSFDRNHDFAPGMYRLLPPSPTVRLAKDSRKRPSGRRAKGSSRVKRTVHRTVRVRDL